MRVLTHIERSSMQIAAASGSYPEKIAPRLRSRLRRESACGGSMGGTPMPL
jgi:hypothetical protein